MRTLVTLLALALAASALAAGPAAAVGDVSDTIVVRLPGAANTPAALALRLSQATFEDASVEDGGADRVLLATQETFADALSSGTLQGTASPLLLTGAAALRSDVLAELDRLGATAVTILGGEHAVGEEVEEALTDLGIEVDRIAGETRIETAIAVAEEVAGGGSGPTTALLARGFGAGGDDTQAFADALAAGAWAAEEGWATLLTQQDVLTGATRRAIQELDLERVVVLGGEAAIAPAVVAELRSMGLDVDRVAGATRFATAAEVARARGFRSAADAERIILVEGQAADAWGAGFAAAAHGARVPAPILLANGADLPPATSEFLLGAAPRLAVDAGDVTEPVLVCAAEAAACDTARAILGLPREAELELDEPADGVPSRSTLTGTVDLFDVPATITVVGPCVEEGLVVPDGDGRFELAVQAEPGACQLRFEVRFDNGTVQRISRSILVTAAAPVDGVVVDTETGGDRYTVAPEGGDRLVEVAYAADDTFTLDGAPATIGAFEAALTIADDITTTFDTAEGTVHELVDVDPATISAGTAGDVDLAAGTVAIIEPLSGVALRRGISLDRPTHRVGGSAVGRDAFEGAVSEGDRLTVVETALSITDREVEGPAGDIAVDRISGIARFAIGALGDDPRNAEDRRFRVVAGLEDQAYAVDGRTATFDELVDALSEGDRVTYERRGGVESFRLRNRAVPPVEGLVTEIADPDGSPVEPEPQDGGTVVVLTPAGQRVEVAYGPGDVFTIDGAVATEAEVEAALTSGDEVAYAPGDGGAPGELDLVQRDLTGAVADVSVGETTVDVVVRAGVVHDDLDYTAAVRGGTPSYVINGASASLDEFEEELLLVSRGERQGTLSVRATPDRTEHRLTSEALP